MKSPGPNSSYPENQNTESENLLSRTLRGLKITTSFTVLKTLLDAAAQLVLLRLLFPEAFGSLAFILASAGFVGCLADWNGGKYLIQKKRPSLSEIHTIFTTELIAAIFFGAIWLFGSSTFLHLLNKEHLIPYAWPFAIWIVTERIQIPRFLLEKELNFGKSNFATFTGVFCGAVLSVILAFMGAGVYSLIFGYLFRSIVTAAVLFYFCPYKLRLRFDRKAAAPYMKFGIPLTITGLFTFYYWNIDYIIVGRFMDDERLGYYYNAFKFAHYILQLQILVSAVVYPAFSKSRDKAQLQRGFSLATKYSGAVAFLPCVFVIAFGEELVRYGMGEKWLPSLRPLQIFTCLAAFRMITVHWYHVYLTGGRTGAMPFLGVFNALGVSLAAFIGARYYDLTTVAAGVTAVNVLVILFAVNVLLRRIIQVKYLSDLKKPAAAGILSLAAAILLNRSINFPHPYIDLGFKIIVSGLVYCGFLYYLDRKSIKRLLKKRE